MDTKLQDVITLENVWKIFGENADKALIAARDQGLSKNDILTDYGCVVGVADASMSIKKGEVFCVMGLSGSGKSTLVRHINRLLEPTAGTVIVEGEDILAKPESDLRKIRASRIGMVFQNFGLLPHRSVRENVALPLEIQGASINDRYNQAETALEIVDLLGWGDRYPGDLSGGMQQRVGLARALAADPPILLMDEPFSALDPLIRRQLQDQFINLSHSMEKTTVFITHDLDEAIRIGHRIAIMKDGAIVQIGTPEEIVTNPQDDYVADFVANISKLKVVHAHRIMESVESYTARQKEEISLNNFPKVRPDMTISELIDIAAVSEHPLSVRDEEGKTIGIIDKAGLLHGIRGDVQ